MRQPMFWALERRFFGTSNAVGSSASVAALSKGAAHARKVCVPAQVYARPVEYVAAGTRGNQGGGRHVVGEVCSNGVGAAVNKGGNNWQVPHAQAFEQIRTSVAHGEQRGSVNNAGRLCRRCGTTKRLLNCRLLFLTVQEP